MKLFVAFAVVFLLALATGQEAYPRAYGLLSSRQLRDSIVDLGSAYPEFISVSTSQQAFNLGASAGSTTDCPFDGSTVGCLNYFGVIQDYVAHPEGTDTARRLPTVMLSGSLHGDERVGPTVIIETASLLLEAVSCEALPRSPSENEEAIECRQELRNKGISDTQRLWLSRLVSTRRIIVVPTANALGYYRNVRQEGPYDPNRDFPFDIQSSNVCMQTVAGRTLNELYLDNIVQMSFTFHGGIELIGYEWGAETYVNARFSPDDTSQSQLGAAFSRYGGAFSGHPAYVAGPMTGPDQVIYPVRGGMEDWAYAGSWDRSLTRQCTPSSYGGYPTSKTNYNDSTLRAFNMLVETSTRKNPLTRDLGTSQDVLSRNTSGNGHVSRNIRLSLAAIDLVEPYVNIIGINDLVLSDDIVPLTGRACGMSDSTVAIPANANTVTVYWTVGGAIEIDDSKLWAATAGDAANAFGTCQGLQPDGNDVSQAFASGASVSGLGFFSDSGARPTGSIDAIGPIFSATVDVSKLQNSEEIVVMTSARVDSSWATQPTQVTPAGVPPQSHMVNARTNPNWYRESAEKIVQGRLDWFSSPITLVRGALDTTAELDARVIDIPPVSAPTPTPSTGFFCFPGNALVTVQGRGETMLQHVSLGDKVMTNSGTFEEVYSFGHYLPDGEAEYLRLKTSSAQLEISKDHMVFVDGDRVVPSSMVDVGDKLVLANGGESTVTEIKQVHKRGIYAPFTSSGTIVVNGVQCSSFVALQEGSPTLWIGSYNTGLNFHYLSLLFEGPHRFWCTHVSTCVDEKYTSMGISTWLDIPHKVVQWWLRGENSLAYQVLSFLILGLFLTVFSFPLVALLPIVHHCRQRHGGNIK